MRKSNPTTPACSFTEGHSVRAYAEASHPANARGKVSFLTKVDDDNTCTRTHRPQVAHHWIDSLLDSSSYMSLNRFTWRRMSSELVELNALYIDLDIHSLSRDRSPIDAQQVWPARFMADLAKKGLPEPSFLNFTGRGLAAIWLIKPLPADAHPRWSETNRCLIEQFRHMGADRSAGDCARVFRIPGTINEKSGLEVRCLGGTLQRYDFDTMSDQIFVAAGRPTRREREKRVRAKACSPRSEKNSGLSQRQRFSAIMRDLEKIVVSWNGVVPEGCRNNFLHILATCLTHTGPACDIADEVWRWAQLAASGLPDAEVTAIITSAERRAAKACSSSPASDGRLHYSGDRIAEMLGITDQGAQTLGLEQVFSEAERARRKAAREIQRRKASGSMSREEWLRVNSASRDKPWEAAGMSRATWYRRGLHNVPHEETDDVRQVHVQNRGVASPGDRTKETTERWERQQTGPIDQARRTAEQTAIPAMQPQNETTICDRALRAEDEFGRPESHPIHECAPQGQNLWETARTNTCSLLDPQIGARHTLPDLILFKAEIRQRQWLFLPKIEAVQAPGTDGRPVV